MMADLEAFASQYENATREFLNTVHELSESETYINHPLEHAVQIRSN